MKRWNTLYDYCRLPIKVITFACLFLAIGYLIQNENVNIFYTIRNQYILLLGETCYRIGHILIINMPLIFLLNLVSKRANSGAPRIMGIIGYVTFLIFTMMFTPHTLASTSYSPILGISYSIPTYGTIYPLQTGLVGGILVALVTRYSYIKSRRPSVYSFLSFVDKDVAGIIYNVLFCALLGIGVALVWPILINFIAQIITWIANDISDPLRLSVYGILDRSLSIVGLGNIIRQPFWFGAQGGTYANLAGETIIGDVNIWRLMPEAQATYSGAGRFITPYYIINMFAIPAMCLGIYSVNTNVRERKKSFLLTMILIGLSFICGNPLPMELTLLFTSPLLLIFHIILSGSLFGTLFMNNAFLGFKYSGSTVSAMPGAFPDYIINARTPQYIHSLLIILAIGVIIAIIYYFVTITYYKHFAFDIAGSNKAKTIANKIIAAVGGEDNIVRTYSSVFKVTIVVEDLERVTYDMLKQIGASTVKETRDSIVLDFCSASTIIRQNIDNIILKSRRK